MPTYRDTWDDLPGVVVVAETELTEDGVLEDAVLFVMDETPPDVPLTDECGQTRRFHLPPQALHGDFVGAGLDLLTEPL